MFDVIKSILTLSCPIEFCTFFVIVRNGTVLFEKSGMKYELKFAILRNDLTSTMVVGLGVLRSAATLSSVGSTPSAEKTTPKNSIFGWKNMHFIDV